MFTKRKQNFKKIILLILFTKIFFRKRKENKSIFALIQDSVSYVINPYHLYNPWGWYWGGRAYDMGGFTWRWRRGCSCTSQWVLIGDGGAWLGELSSCGLIFVVGLSRYVVVMGDDDNVVVTSKKNKLFVFSWFVPFYQICEIN